MKKIIILFFVANCFVISAQNKTDSELKSLNDTKQYDKIITQYAPKAKELSATSLYYIGLAYYMKEDDKTSIKYMDLAIAKDPKDPKAYYIKGFALNYANNYLGAIKCLTTAISLKSDDPNYYSSLGDSYCGLKKFDEGLAAYKKATTQKNCAAHPYTSIADIYLSLHDEKKALEAYYNAKAGVPKTDEAYPKILYGIGMLETKLDNDAKAEQAYLDLLTLNANDYNAFEKLIQVYYKLRDYNKAKPYKDKLYAAHSKGVQLGNLQDAFCVEQFKWQDKTVLAYERYEQGEKKDVYEKNMFHVLNKDYTVALKVQTEYSPIAKELGGPKYLLCAYKGTTHYNSGVGFNDGAKYEHIRAASLEFIEKLLK